MHKKKNQLVLGKVSLNPLFWSLKYGVLDNGSRMRFLPYHKYLMQPMWDPHPYAVHQKGSQLGFTVLALNKYIFYPSDCCLEIKGSPVRILYYMPTESDVSDLSRDRVKAMILGDQSEYLKKITDQNNLDSVGIKKIGNGTVYFRGMGGKVRTKSVPGDILIFDELDEMIPSEKAQALHRIDHSTWKWVCEISTPSVPGYGVNVEFERSDQKHFFVICSVCRKENLLNKEFPDCMQYETQGSGENLKVFNAKIVCVKCRSPLNVFEGKWIALKPNNTDRSGYCSSQLQSKYINLNETVKLFLQKKHMQLFYNHVLGLPYVDAFGQVSIKEILACRRDYPMQQTPSVKSSFMGVDQGDILHVIIQQILESGKIKTIFFKAVDKFQDLDQLIRKYEVVSCVIDALPNQHSARDLADRFPGRVWLNYYDKTKGETSWDEKQSIVHTNRTETIDAALYEIRNQQIFFPACDELDLLAQHINNLVKKEEENHETGEKRWVYIHKGDDHFGHALNYAKIARSGKTAFGSPVIYSKDSGFI